MSGNSGRGDSREHKHETSDVNIRLITLSGAGLAIFLLLSLLAVAATFFVLGKIAPKPDEGDVRIERKGPAPQPRLQVTPAKDLQTIMARENKILASYGWIDRKNGVIRIPIAQAMQKIAQRSRTPKEPVA